MTVIDEIQTERERQVTEEGWTHEHDDAFFNRGLSMAAACYAAGGKIYQKCEHVRSVHFNEAWPWDDCHDKREKHDERRQLVIAGALIIAEIERLDRRALKKQETTP